MEVLGLLGNIKDYLIVLPTSGICKAVCAEVQGFFIEIV